MKDIARARKSMNTGFYQRELASERERKDKMQQN